MSVRKKIFRRKSLWICLLLSIVACGFFWNCLPDPLFVTPTSTVLTDRNGNLMGARIAEDGQWRFPFNKNVSEKFSKAIIQFEDKRFYRHPGVDVIAMIRATYQNLKSGSVKSGGSTLSMQVIRLSHKGRPRTITQKFIELVMALRLEIKYSKEEILALYASQAPFGSNVVGLDAAAWRYYGKNENQLSWGEITTLAVLPNSPSLVHPGKNMESLKKKRNRLLEKLRDQKEIDSVACNLAKAEPLPEKPHPLPRYAAHLLTRTYLENFKNKAGVQTETKSTLDRELQIQVNNIISRHHQELKGNGINNAAALIADVETGNVIAYVGNISEAGSAEFDSDVDIITAPRSTGSILKPFLFSAMLGEGELLPGTLVPDIPTQIAGYAPQNFSREYDGAVPAKRALERSLNVPAVRMLQNYGIEKFNLVLKKAGMTTLNQPAGHYGLSIILGGAEGSLWDIAGMYASAARTLNHFGQNSGRYDKNDFHPLRYIAGKKIKSQERLNPDATGILSASSIWCTFNAMEEVSRPDMETNWKLFSSSQRIAWKTGTSFGFRDGWAIGCTPKYVVAVWVGNADGEGRPGLIGVATAAPVMFDIFKLLKPSAWFEQPYDEMSYIPVCKQSGHRAAEICNDIDSMWVPTAGLKTVPCTNHQLIHLDKSGKWRVNSDCESPSNMIHLPWFVLPPAQEWYYKTKNHQYKTLPPYRKDCNAANKSTVMEFIYPKKSNQIYVPVELDGKTGKTIFEVVHRSADAVIYWHLDDDYIGYTKGFHQMGLSPAPGKHQITIVDQDGEQLVEYFEVLNREKN
ncbi:MAG: penicillin-binding protein 1C [Bacteroidota bacterium]